MSDHYEYEARDGQAVDIGDHVYVDHDGYCRAEITDSRIDETGALLLVECEDGPNWVYESEIWAEAPEERRCGEAPLSDEEASQTVPHPRV